MLRWFARNDIASNVLMVAILVGGIYAALNKIPLEVQPSFKFNRVEIHVDYRGGSPEDVERAVVIPIERAMEGIPGVATIQSEASAGGGRVILEAAETADVEKLFEEAQLRMDSITTLPPETEPPRIRIPDTASWWEVIKVAVVGDLSEADLLRATRRVRDDLTEMRGISQAVLQGDAPLEISIEADPRRLRDHGLTFQDLTDAIRNSSIDLPAGTIDTDEGSLQIRSRGQAYERDDFAQILLVNSAGSELRLGDVARISDGFEESQKLVRLNGRPALLVEVLRRHDENALQIADTVREYVETAPTRFPDGIELHVWSDSSIDLRGRLGTLTSSLLQGGILVLVLLGLFLRPMLAFWVVIGIPVSAAGGLIMMAVFGMTANVMSLFGFIIVIGIVVDDAIVTGENVYLKLREGLPALDAAVIGAKEVAIPVTFGVMTTIVAFVPMMFFTGFWGVFTRQIPPVVAAVLIFSLIESKWILPGHLKHLKTGRTRFNRFTAFQKKIADSLELFVDRFYRPSLRIAVKQRYLVIAAFIALGMVMIGVIQSGKLGFVNMPSLDRNSIIARVVMPANTDLSDTDVQVERIASYVDQLREEFRDPGTGESLILDVLTSTGGWVGRSGVRAEEGFVVIEVLDPGFRSEPGPRNSVIANRWLELVGEIPEARSFWISSDSGGGFSGDDDLESIEIQVRGDASPLKDDLLDQATELLESYPGIASAWNDSGRSREEIQITIKPEGQALGLTQQDLARQMRSAFFGVEAQRVQRERDEIRVMVRLPRDYRESLHTLDILSIRTPDGGEAPFHSVATATLGKSRSNIRREDGAQVASIRAKPVDEEVDIIAISEDLVPRLNALFDPHPELSWRYQGYVAENEETQRRLWIGGTGLFLALFSLLAIPFRSLVQPFLVLSAVPFGIIGALWGHMLMDVTPSYLSIFGMLALAGVVVNDSLVMVDFTNQHVRAGQPLMDSVIGSGTRRFRPILLTSITTFAGLMPLMFDRSLQAQFLIPMAISLGFGILFATAITLYLVPAGYVVIEDARARLTRAWRWYRRPFSPAGASPTAADGSPVS